MHSKQLKSFSINYLKIILKYVLNLFSLFSDLVMHQSNGTFLGLYLIPTKAVGIFFDSVLS